jgi:hypothetical protein
MVKVFFCLSVFVYESLSFWLSGSLSKLAALNNSHSEKLTTTKKGHICREQFVWRCIIVYKSL